MRKQEAELSAKIVELEAWISQQAFEIRKLRGHAQGSPRGRELLMELAYSRSKYFKRIGPARKPRQAA